MSTLEIAIRIAAGIVLTLLNAFFVVTEFALTRLRQLPAAEFQDDKRLRLAWKMTERLEFYLTGCQLGISSTSVVLGVVAEPAVTTLIRPAAELVGLEGRALTTVSIVVAVVIINLVHKIWGEQAPTYLGVERPKQVARLAAPVHYAWCKATYPLIALGDGLAKWTLRLFGVEMRRSWVEDSEAREEVAGAERERPASRADVRRAMGEVLARGRISEDRQEEVMRALEIEEVPVRDIMIPRDDIVAVRGDRSPEEALERIRDSGHTRIPLVGAELEDYRGILYLPALIRHLPRLEDGRARLEELAADPLAVSADLPVSRLIDRFQEAEQELALVKEDGRVVGLVTTTDAFEAIIGELRDPYD